jgi:hypothetical protein
MQLRAQVRHRGASRSSPLMGARSGVGQAPGMASSFRRKCCEYTGPARQSTRRLAQVPNVRGAR